MGKSKNTAGRRPDPEPEQAKGGRTGKPFTLWFAEDLDAKIDNFIENSPVKPTKKAVIIAALEEFFERRGV